jgi:hypothetical protein
MTNKHTKVVAVNEKLAQGGNVGAIVWWVLNGTISYTALVSALVRTSLDAGYMPPPVTADCALRRAVKKQEEKRFLARPLGRGTGWALVQEKVTENGESLVHETVCKVKLTDTESMICEPAGHPVGEMVRAAYVAARDEFTPQDVSAWVVRVADSMRALRLREKGGVYFIPSTVLPMWSELVEAIRTAHSGHSLYEVPAMKSEEAVRAILDSLVREAEEEATEMRNELTAGTLGGRALNGRADRCAAVTAKVKEYEELLGVTQTALTTSLDSLRADLTVAALSAMDDSSANVDMASAA